MYKFMLIILSLVVVIFSSSCAPYPVVATIPVNKISEKVGLPFGTVITLGGKKMIVISQENEEVRLKPHTSAIVKPAIVKADLPKPEWVSKTVVTEGVKNVQECLNLSGCPQDTKTGECLEGCAEVQKVRIEMTETIIDPEKITANNASNKLNYNLVLNVLFRIDHPGVQLELDFPQYYGKPAWICVMANFLGTPHFRIELTKLIYSNPPLLKICNTAWSHSSTNKWVELKKKYSL